MNGLHKSSQPIGSRRGTALLQLFNIVNEDHSGIVGIDNVKPSPVAPHFSTLPINSKSLLIKNVVASNLGGSLHQFFSRLTQGVVFAFLRGECKLEELPCLQFSSDTELNELNKKMPTVEKDDQEVTQVKDTIPNQGSVFDFLNGDVCQLLNFLVDFDLGSGEMDYYNPNVYESLSKHLSLLDLSSSSDESHDTSYSIQENGSSSTTSHELQLTNHYAKAHDDVEWIITDRIVKDDGFSGEIDENILYSPFHYCQKILNDDPLSDSFEISDSHQCYGSENCFGVMSKLNCDAGIFEQTFKFTLDNYGFVIGNYHEGTVAGTPMLLSSSKSIVPPVDEEHNKNCDSTSSYHQSLDSFSDSQKAVWAGVHNNNTSHCRITDSSNGCESEVFGNLEHYPAIGNTEDLKFCFPDPDELMNYLHGSLSSPKFMTSDPSIGESDNFYFSAHFGIRNSDEVAKLDNLSASHTNSSHGDVGNDNEYGMFDTFDYSIESGIGATTGVFGEIETSPIPRLPNISQIEEIRCNWSSLKVDPSAFDFDDHQDLLEWYGLSEQDVQANDDEFCDSPTWPGKL